MPLIIINSKDPVADIGALTAECGNVLETNGKKLAALRLINIVNPSLNNSSVSFSALDLKPEQVEAFGSFAKKIADELNGRDIEGSSSVTSYSSKLWFRRDDTMASVVAKEPSRREPKKIEGSGEEAVATILVKLKEEVLEERAQLIATKLTDLADKLKIDNTVNSANTLRVIVQGGTEENKVNVILLDEANSKVSNLKKGIAEAFGIDGLKVEVTTISRNQITTAGKSLAFEEEPSKPKLILAIPDVTDKDENKVPRESRVSFTPEQVKKLIADGCEVRMQAGAAALAGFSDADYSRIGVKVSANREEVFKNVDAVCWPKPPVGQEGDLTLTIIGKVAPNAVCIGLMGTNTKAKGNPGRYNEREVNTLSFELLRETQSDVATALMAGTKQNNIITAKIATNETLKEYRKANSENPQKAMVIAPGKIGGPAAKELKARGLDVTVIATSEEKREEFEKLGIKFVVCPYRIPKEVEQEAIAAAKANQMEFYDQQIKAINPDILFTAAARPGEQPRILDQGTIDELRKGVVVCDVVGGNVVQPENRNKKTLAEGGAVIIHNEAYPTLDPRLSSPNVGDRMNPILEYMLKQRETDINYKFTDKDPVLGGGFLTFGGETHPKIAAQLDADRTR